MIDALIEAGANPNLQAEGGKYEGQTFNQSSETEIAEAKEKYELHKISEARAKASSKGEAHNWKELLKQFDKRPGLVFDDILEAVEGDIYLLPKKCFEHYLKSEADNISRVGDLAMKSGASEVMRELISIAASSNKRNAVFDRKEHKSLGSKIDRALFNLNKSLKYAAEEIKDFFINPDRGGAKFIQAMKDVFAAIKKFFVETIPNFTERAWSQVRENVLIPAQKNIDLAIDHVNEAISKGFTPKYVSSISGAVSEAYAENREIIKKRAKAGIEDEKLKRAIQDLDKEDRKIIKDIMKDTRGSSSKSEYDRDETLNKAREHRDALRDAASNGDKEALQEVVQKIKQSREEYSAVSSSRPFSGSRTRGFGGNSSPV